MSFLASFLSRKIELWKVVLVAAAGVAFAYFGVRWNIRKELVATGNSSSLGVEELVARLRSELETMEEHRVMNARTALFRLKDFDLELSFVVKQTDKQSGKVEYQVVTAEMERELGTENTHKVTLHMTPVETAALHSGPSTEHLTSEGAIELPALTLKKGSK